MNYKELLERELRNLDLLHTQQITIYDQSLALDVVISLLLVLVAIPTCTVGLINNYTAGKFISVGILGSLDILNVCNLINCIYRVIRIRKMKSHEDTRWSELRQQLLYQIDCACAEDEKGL